MARNPRGIRNNNPGNIELGESWQGLSDTQTDGRFAQFDDPAYGIRAIYRILNTYQTKYGLGSVRGMVNRWAPPNENDTGAYVDAVAAAVGVDPDAKIDMSQHGPALVSAIIHHENGMQPYSPETLARGFELAFGAAPGVQVHKSSMSFREPASDPEGE